MKLKINYIIVSLLLVQIFNLTDSNLVSDLKNKIKFLNEPNLFNNVNKQFSTDNTIECLVCNLAIPLAQILIEKNETKHIKPLVAYFCNELKYLGPVVCDQLVEQYGVNISSFENLSISLSSSFCGKDTAISILKDTKLDGVDLCDATIGCGVSKNTLLGMYRAMLIVFFLKIFYYINK